MEQAIVENTSAVEVAVMFDGFQIYFKPGQKKVFSKGVALHISNESEFLSLVVEEEAKEVEEEVEETDEVAEVVAPVIKCKKCGFETDSKGKLLSHYKEAHKK